MSGKSKEIVRVIENEPERPLREIPKPNPDQWIPKERVLIPEREPVKVASWRHGK